MLIFILSLLVSVFFAVHAVRSGQSMYWLFILFLFPGLGSIVYFFAIFLPNSRLQSKAQKIFKKTAKSFDPSKDIRLAREAFEYTPSVQNRILLAAALLNAGMAEEAASNYEACLKGAFATDREIKFCAAQAFIGCNKFGHAIELLESLRADDANYRAEQVSLLIARAFGGVGRKHEAKLEFEAGISKFAKFESFAEYAIWAYEEDDFTTATRLETEIDLICKHWNRNSRELNSKLIRRLKAAKTAANQRRS